MRRRKREMLKSYEAIYQKGDLHWVDEQPPIESARVIVTILTDQQAVAKRRHPPPSLAGKVEILGDMVSPIVDEGDWECLK